MLGLGAVLLIAVVVVVLLVTGGSSSNKSHQVASHSTTTSSTTSTPTTSSTSSTTPQAKPVAQVNLNSPTGPKSRKGIAEVISETSGATTTLGVLIYAANVPANSKTNAYAVWLYNSGSDSKLVGFVNSRVGTSGKLETEGPLPANASHFKHVLVTLETKQTPKVPGPVVLEGPLNLS